jgi:hypothetical protein
MIIGSTAAKHWFHDFPREPKDLDLAVPHLRKFDGERADLTVCPVLWTWYLENSSPIPEYIGRNELYTLKISHIFWNKNWDKHFADIQFFHSKGCKIIWPLFWKLYNYWQEHAPLVRSDLQQSAKDFFNNALPDGHLHDDLHLLINPNPGYKQILIGEVETSDELFFQLPDSEKARVIVEEVMVMAYERLAGRTWYVAYAWMLKKFLREHSPIKQAIWGIENFELIRKPYFNFQKHIDNAKINR